MKLQVSSRGATVEITGSSAMCGYASDTDMNYAIHAEASNTAELLQLIACAEPEGSETRKAVEDTIHRAQALWDEWNAGTQEYPSREGAGEARYE